ncbi:MAG TPA: pilus assembly PilX N-terminal domain-containing protein [Myxococcota bacterium]|jgi:hypothetical protein|nr:pilus assembly PilX N-terminal domain-containing protein [Myxococcota bacterium]
MKTCHVSTTPAPRARRRESGAALLVAVMMLVLMGLIGLAALDTATRDRQTAGLQSRGRSAFYAADAGFAVAMNLVRSADERTDKPPLAQTQIGDAPSYAIYGGQPTYQGDPSAADPIVYVMDAGPPEGMSLQVPPQFVDTLWHIQVQGQTADGAVGRVDAMAKKILDSGF